MPRVRRPKVRAEVLGAARVVELSRALSDPVRVGIVGALRDRGDGLSQREFLPVVGITQPTLSHHLKVLGSAGLVSSRRHGKERHYTLDHETLAAFAAWLA
jgi:ArsR family transcriptional regulator